MLQEYQALVQMTQLSRSPPALEFYDDLHDVGGLFSGADWVIMVGLRDMERIAARVLSKWSERVADIYANGNGGARPTREVLRNYVHQAATRRCMAHEIGHALIYRGAANRYAPDGEAGADYYAGRLDAERRRSQALGEIFFWTIGCVGSSCDHPSPDDRAAAYNAGYADQLAGR
jgi:hypothetical protein